jgi:predicted metal-dependent hydrolase
MSLPETSFSYIVRESVRAKQLQLRITQRHGLEVVVPKRLKNNVDIASLLHTKRHWIQKHVQMLENKADPEASFPGLPQQITLKSLKESWTVHYLSNPRWKLLENPLRELTLFGNIQDLNSCQKYLIHWLKRKAKIYLGELLLQLSDGNKLPFRSFQIRGQQTRWGSCSSQGDISLNYQLLFLPPQLVRHILLHELVHTVHMNHGVRFWRLLMKCDSQTKAHAYEARRAHIYVPKWVLTVNALKTEVLS